MGGKNGAYKVMLPREVLGVCSPRNCLKFTCSEVASGAQKKAGN